METGGMGGLDGPNLESECLLEVGEREEDGAG